MTSGICLGEASPYQEFVLLFFDTAGSAFERGGDSGVREGEKNLELVIGFTTLSDDVLKVLLFDLKAHSGKRHVDDLCDSVPSSVLVTVLDVHDRRQGNTLPAEEPPFICGELLEVGGIYKFFYYAFREGINSLPVPLRKHVERHVGRVTDLDHFFSSLAVHVVISEQFACLFLINCL